MIKSVTMYSVVCDRCGKPFIDEFNGIVAWVDECTANVKLEDGYYVAIAPNKRSKQGKVIASVLLSYKSVANHFEVMEELNIEVSLARRFSITQLLRHKDRIFVYFDDGIRAEKRNSDFKEITIGEYEDFINSKD